MIVAAEATVTAMMSGKCSCKSLLGGGLGDGDGAGVGVGGGEGEAVGVGSKLFQYMTCL